MTKETALQYIEKHVRDMMTHFGDDVYVWDVCNEVLRNDITSQQLAAGDIWRTGSEATGDNMVDWYALCGTDYIVTAFRTAMQVKKELGLKVKLYYNDYNLNGANKRAAVLKLVELLEQNGVEIDGIGMQAHYRLTTYQTDSAAFMENFEASVNAFTAHGLDVQVTELDIRVYASDSAPQEYETLPEEVEAVQAQMFADIFAVCRKYAVQQGSDYGTVTNVTTWGVADDHTSWTNENHIEFPLIFGSDFTPKQAYYAIIDF